MLQFVKIPVKKLLMVYLPAGSIGAVLAVKTERTSGDLWPRWSENSPVKYRSVLILHGLK